MYIHPISEIVGAINPYNRGGEDGKNFDCSKLIDKQRNAKGGLSPVQPTTISNVDEGLAHLDITVRMNLMSRASEVNFSGPVEKMLLANGWGLDAIELRLDVMVGALSRARMNNATKMKEFCMNLCAANKYHPGEEWMLRLPRWDGGGDPIADLLRTIRLNDEAEDRATFNAAMRLFFIQAVQATLGWQNPKTLPYVPILVSHKQGIGKTEFVKRLMPAGFTKENVTLTGPGGAMDKDTMVAATACIIAELGEAAMLRKADVNRLKGFLSNTGDVVRLPYARAQTVFPRVTTYIGTANETALLSDASGNRRFWPFVVADIDFAAVDGLRDAAWAQALSLWHSGETYHPDDALRNDLNNLSEEHRSVSPLEEALTKQLGNFADVNWQEVRKCGMADVKHHVIFATATDVAAWVFGRSTRSVSPQDVLITKNWLDRNGFAAKGQQRVNGVQRRGVYALPESTNWGLTIGELPASVRAAVAWPG